MNFIILRNPNTGKLHRGAGNASLCNHSGNRRVPTLRPATDAEISRAANSTWCAKCFPTFKPAT
ncbi:hypothetical protein [Bradyrhizobium yuanmingense]|uniref:hypothetical protein n=1 Tax=Bradyrhizobium yuanmingense TaxID=108015 RepID=UPI000567C9C0|nr:hypothetical protein [Bradyrhizobium yuanmingense]